MNPMTSSDIRNVGPNKRVEGPPRKKADVEKQKRESAKDPSRETGGQGWF